MTKPWFKILVGTALMGSVACATADETGSTTSSALSTEDDALTSALLAEQEEATLDGVEEGIDEELSGDEAEMAARMSCDVDTIYERLITARDEDKGRRRGFGGKAARREPVAALELDVEVGEDETADDEREEVRRAPHRYGFFFRRGLRRGLKWIYDVDRDRALSDAELSTMAEDLAARCENRRARLLANFDADEDGTLSDAEREEVREALEARREARKAELLALGDVDGDGRLSRFERRSLMRQVRMQTRRQIAGNLRAADTDRDGILSDDEHAAAIAEARERVRGEAISA